VTANLLFVFQLLCIILFGGGQIFQMFKTTEGVSVSWILCSEVFFLINFFLVLRGHRQKQNRGTYQALICYGTLLIAGVFEFLLVLWNPCDSSWNIVDLWTFCIVFLGSITVFVYARINDHPLSNPVIKALIATLMIAVPQLTMGYNIYREGGAGVSVLSIVVGHICVSTRLGQLSLVYTQARCKYVLTTIASETANWGSWIVVTIIWINR
jgi:hypothetical protein